VSNGGWQIGAMKRPAFVFPSKGLPWRKRHIQLNTSRLGPEKTLFLLREAGFSDVKELPIKS
jgi:hypothetical protein